MPQAWCLIRDRPDYRREAFVAGLKAAGFSVDCQDYRRPMIPWGRVQRGDVLLCWNRYGIVEQIADRFEQVGGRVLVSENGYLGNDENGRQHYALARKGHNGSGSWYCGGPERWERLGFDLKPWREDGDHILVCPNRAFGPKGFAMPSNWADDVMQRLRRHTKRPIRLRPHPGNKPPEVPLADDMKGAWAVVIWASSAGVHALLAGIPVYREAPHWVAAEASERDIAGIEAPSYLDRRPAFEKLAWCQWTCAELASGEPFRMLCA